jgi:hypothetical protein
MTSRLLDAYLGLETQMLALDAQDNPDAESVRDAMDPLWHALTSEDRAWLNRRTDPGAGRPVVIPWSLVALPPFSPARSKLGGTVRLELAAVAL